MIADPSQHKSALSGRNDVELMDTIGDSLSHISLQWVPNLLHVVLLLMTVGQRGAKSFLKQFRNQKYHPYRHVTVQRQVAEKLLKEAAPLAWSKVKVDTCSFRRRSAQVFQSCTSVHMYMYLHNCANDAIQPGSAEQMT